MVSRKKKRRSKIIFFCKSIFFFNLDFFQSYSLNNCGVHHSLNVLFAGKLEPDEVRAALKALGSEMTDEKFTKMFNNLDKTHKGALSFSEFKKVLYQRIVYEAIDEDVSGSLDRDEIRESFKCILKLTVTDDEFEE